MFAIFDSKFKKGFKLYQDADNFFSNQNFQSAFNAANVALNHILKDKNKSLRKILMEHNLVCANLYFIRATSLLRISSQDTHVFDRAVDDYKASLSYLTDDKKNLIGAFSILVAISDTLLVKSEYQKNSFVEQAFPYIEDAQKILNKHGTENCDEQYILKMHRARCHALEYGENSHYDPEKAINLLNEVYIHSCNKGDKAQIFGVVCLLADIYLRLFYRGDETYLDSAICALEEYLTLADDASDDSRVNAMIDIGRLFFIKSRGESDHHLRAAYSFLQKATEYIDKEKYPESWSMAILDLIDITLKNKTWSPFLNDIDNLKESTFELVEEVFNLQKDRFVPEIISRAISIQKNICKKYGETSQIDILEKLLFLADDIKNDEARQHLYLDILLDLASEYHNLKRVDKAIETYKDIINRAESPSILDIKIDAYFGLGNLYTFAKNDRETASSYFAKGVSTFIQYYLSKEHNEKFTDKSKVTTGKYVFLVANYVTLSVGEIKNALISNEISRLHNLTPHLEILLAIEKQLKRKYLMEQYAITKQSDYFLYFDNKKEGEERNIEEYKDRLILRKGYANKIKDQKYRFAEIVQEENSSEKYFIKNFDKMVRRLNCWTFLPIQTTDSTIMVLLPPNSDISKAIASEPVDVGYQTVLAKLVDMKNNRRGWIGLVADYGKRGPEIESEYTNEQEIEIKFDELDSQRDRTIEEVGAFLWDNFGKWITDSIVQHENPNKQLAIISQGGLSLLPFSMARDSHTQEYLSDFVNVSYAPSLFALYSLQERLSYDKYQPKLGFVGDSDGLNYVALEYELYSKAFWSKNESNTLFTNLEMDKVIPMLTETTYWHVTAHGEVKWGNYADSAIARNKDNSGKNNHGLTPEIFSLFYSDTFLRLVTLATCQSGIPEFLDNPNAPESFLTEVLKSGAIGTIGTLWTIPDEASAIFFGKFYEYHIQRDQSPSTALAMAQKWMREVNAEDLCSYIMEKGASSDLSRKQAQNFVNEIDESCNAADTPFDRPFFWAGFILIGQ